MFNLRYLHQLFSIFIISIIAASGTVAASPAQVGVLIGSYGDVDAPNEVKDLVVNTLTDKDVLPIPGYLSRIIAELGYKLVRSKLLDEYKAIGGSSHMRARTAIQAEKVAKKLQELGYDAKGYAGFTMTFPYVKETLKQVQADGVEKLVVFYEGAQFSQVTAFIVFREVEDYLLKHPEWKVDVVGLKSFSDDSRFQDQVMANIEKTWQQSFAKAQPQDVCIFLPMHGNVLSWIEKGDPYLDQVMRVVDAVKNRFPDNHVVYGFQNHDELPFVKWTGPQHERALDQLAKEPCTKVISSGQISFTVDSLETLYDHNIGERQYLAEAAAKAGVEKQLSLVPMFNDDENFVKLLAQLSDEALQGYGDLVRLGTGELKKLDLQP